MLYTGLYALLRIHYDPESFTTTRCAEYPLWMVATRRYADFYFIHSCCFAQMHVGRVYILFKVGHYTSWYSPHTGRCVHAGPAVRRALRPGDVSCRPR